MKKIPFFCNVISLLLVIVFFVKTFIKYTQYSATANSAPFYACILLNAFYFILPALILLALGAILNKKNK